MPLTITIPAADAKHTKKPYLSMDGTQKFISFAWTVNPVCRVYDAIIIGVINILLKSLIEFKSDKFGK